MRIILLVAIIALSYAKVLDAETLVKLQKLSLGCHLNGVVYYTSSQWFEEENKTKHSLKKLTLTETEPVDLIPYSEESFSNFVCLNEGVYLLHNGQIAKIENDKIVDVTSTPISIDTFKMISVDGKLRGLASMTVFPGMTLEESANKFIELEKQNYRVYDQLMIRRWDTYWDGQFQHLFTFKEEEDNSFTFKDIMNDKKYDCPARPFGGNEEYDISPDGTKIAFSILLENPASSLDNNVYYATFDNPLEWNCITTENKGYDNQPLFNNDGSLLYYLSMSAPKDESDKSVLKSYDFNQKVIRDITGNIDLSFSAPMKVVGNYMHLSTQIEGNVYIVGLDTSKSELTREDVNIITQKGTAGSFVFTTTGMIYEYNSFTLPQELFLYENKIITQITHINQEVLSTIKFGEYKEIHYTGANNDQIHAFITYPPNMKTNIKYPVILYTHGGPESPWTNNFHYRWNPQVIAAQGYIVFAPNFHGSGSYGDAFLKAIRKNWGGWPFEDLMKGMDYLKTSEPLVDIDNACAMGASYGGYMMNWINSQNTGRFKCIICHDGIMDSEGSYYYMDEMYFLETEFGYPMYEDDTYYKKYSPLNYVNGYNTPQLTIHGGSDYRIDVVAGYQQFVTLQRKNIESKLVIYPEENHWVLRPYNSIDWHAQVFDWLAKYLPKK
ncbi:hypothetical protein ENUP19_0054G0014 [Entamoeba nuttalli]|uniref:Dipeptidyl-peptidase, putative n=2 Tax=Entamoeba nuttalli TaxID=412467 RepID=K2H2W5_ENTNP|nr:dipeptidyl-peptidase, putative [Entamoeba nuttalli P19]EKE40692.1 dipeptidyl-peptidase, putative [Entamoeba nuttalli P19]|eukprot:XP_008856974.1 dipeptidyl-peptidase, putative [Entamoeba nuttalli P19]